MNAAGAAHPWALSFSYARALQATAMRTWRGQPQNVPAAQDALAHRARCNSAAREGRYTAEQVSDFVGSRIARFKRPHMVAFTDALPRAADGSVDREAVKTRWGTR